MSKNANDASLREDRNDAESPKFKFSHLAKLIFSRELHSTFALVDLCCRPLLLPMPSRTLERPQVGERLRLLGLNFYLQTGLQFHNARGVVPICIGLIHPKGSLQALVIVPNVTIFILIPSRAKWISRGLYGKTLKLILHPWKREFQREPVLGLYNLYIGSSLSRGINIAVGYSHQELCQRFSRAAQLRRTAGHHRVHAFFVAK